LELVWGQLTCMLMVFYFPELPLELRVFCNEACIQQRSFYVFLYIHAVVRHVTMFGLVHYCNYLFLTAFFSCTFSYMQHDYYQRTSQCVTSSAGSLPIVSRHPLNRNWISRVCYKQMVITPKPYAMDQNGLHFQKLAFINILHSQHVLIHLLRFNRGRRLNVCKIRKVIICFG
jgi:hypothetical protein